MKQFAEGMEQNNMTLAAVLAKLINASTIIPSAFGLPFSLNHDNLTSPPDSNSSYTTSSSDSIFTPARSSSDSIIHQVTPSLHQQGHQVTPSLHQQGH